MNKASGEKIKEEERAARKKSKRKKVTRANEAEDQGSEEKVDDTDEGSRSTSRGRKPLSSLFRKSGDSNQRSRSRSESREKSKVKSKRKHKGHEETLEASSDNVNPRNDPREHFRRMTVREALKDSRARGRSPGRPTARLERSILDLTTEGHRDSLMSSAPHLSDMLRNDEIDSAKMQTENKSGSTLPRAKRHHRHRGHSAETASHKRSKTNDREHMLSQNLPLDKRKYMIDKDKINSSNQETPSAETINTVSHSMIQEPISPTYAASTYLEQEKSRRESFNQFLQLRDNIPNRHSSSSLSTGRDSITEENSIFPEHNTDVSNIQFTNSPNNGEKYLVKLPSYEDAIAEKNKECELKAANQISKDDDDSDNEEFLDCLSSPTSPVAERPSATTTAAKPDIRKHIFFKTDSASIIKSNSERPNTLSNHGRNSVPVTKKQFIKATNFDDTVTKVKEAIVAQPVQPVSRQESLRHAYVSPRTFSRASKASVKSDDSSVSVVSNEHPSSPLKTEISIENEIDTQTIPKLRPKYQRHFSKKQSEKDATENEAHPTSIINDSQENKQEEATEQQQQEAKTLSASPNTENKDTTDDDSGVPKDASKNTISSGGSNQNVSIQIGSKTYIAAVSAFKALLGRSKRANGANNTTTNLTKSLPETKTPQIKENNSFEIPNEVKVDFVNGNKSDFDCEPKFVRPKFTLTTENDSSSISVIQTKTQEDDEVFESVQGDTKGTKNESKSEEYNHIEKREEEVKPEHLLSLNETLVQNHSVSQDVTPLIQPGDSDKHFRRISDQSTDSEDYERRNSLPVISSRLSQDSHSNLSVDNKTAKAKSDLDLSERKEYAMKDEQTETDFDVKRLSLDSKVKKGKGKHKQKKVKGKAKKKALEIQKKEAKESHDPSIKGILKKPPEAQKTNDDGHKRIEKVGSRGKLTRERRIEKAPLVAQRSTSLTDIRTEKVEDKHRKPRKTKSTSHMRSRSYDNISGLPQKADRKKSKPSIDKGVAEGTTKPPARLSISAIVALRSKLARIRKAKQKVVEPNVESETDHLEQQTDDNAGETFTDGDKALIENEVNVSLGKLTVSTENDVIDDELDNIYERKIKFDPYCHDDLSEEELIKQRQRNTRLTSRRESKVRQRQKKVINCCKKFIAFLFSHIGLCSLMVGYSIAGGFIFQELEAPYEMQKNNEMENLRKTILQNIWDLAFEVNYNKGSRDVFKREVDAILKNYSQRIQRETKESGWDGDGGSLMEGDDVVKQAKLWSFPSSLLFAITVMTTIGKLVIRFERLSSIFIYSAWPSLKYPRTAVQTPSN